MIGNRIRSQERVSVELNDDLIGIIVSMDRQLKGTEIEFPIPIRIEDISEGGLKFWSRQELMIGLAMNFRMRVEGYILDVKAKILRCRNTDPGIYEIAAQFNGMSRHSEHVIKTFIKKKSIQNIWESRRRGSE